MNLYRHRKSKVVNPSAPQPPVAPWVVIMTTQGATNGNRKPQNRRSTVINDYGRIRSHRSPKLFCQVFCESTCNVFPGDNLGTGRQRVAMMPPCRHPRHRRLSFWQPAMPPATTKSAPRQLSVLSGRISCGDICKGKFAASANTTTKKRRQKCNQCSFIIIWFIFNAHAGVPQRTRTDPGPVRCEPPRADTGPPLARYGRPACIVHWFACNTWVIIFGI